ncbi:MAG TPA: DEAD/DEAH box helicase, partial [Gammaproteobacteria bacterium]|nr:DEAD/DEAH box helicase [Gammaproteobacteria bacterium]
RMLTDDLLSAVFPDAAACQDNLGGRDIELPDHPLTNEAIKTALTEAMDIDGFTKILKDIENGQIHCIAVDTPLASPFSHEILNANPYAYLDDAPLEERRSRAVEMRHMLPDSLLKDIAKLDLAAIHAVQEEAWPDVRDSDELHDILQTLIIVPEKFILEKNPEWSHYLQKLIEDKRAGKVLVGEHLFWLCTENKNYFTLLYENAVLLHELPTLTTKKLMREEIIVNAIQNWLAYLGPSSEKNLSDLFLLNASEIEQALLRLESSGSILRGHFKSDDKEWCERRLLARIHRLTIAKLRKEIEPVNASQFMQWLLKWQHVTADTKLQGKDGILRVITQLQGYEIPAHAWESEIFPSRIKDYDPDMLDFLCLTGVIGWGRFSAHPAQFSHRRVIPTKRSPIAFFLRDNPIWISKNPLDEKSESLSHAAKKVLQHLKKSGASFFVDMIHQIASLKTEIEMALWELVSAGLVTADAFDNLRALIHAKRRHRQKIYPQSGRGRWSLLQFNLHEEEIENEAFCRVLLQRYGIVFRDLLAKEKLMPPWKDLSKTFRRLEARGEIRGGRFIHGFLGEQFALPYALESLRIFKKEPPNDTIETLSAMDPLNLTNILLPNSRIPSISNQKIHLSRGHIIP